MQIEMEERLIELAQNFQNATTIRIANETHKAIKENISLNRELDLIFRTCRELDFQNKEYKDRDRLLRFQISLSNSEAKMALKKVLKQNQIINKLSDDYLTMNIIYGRVQRAESLVQRNELLMDNCKRNSNEMMKKIFILEKHIEKSSENEKEIIDEVIKNHKEIEKLEKILRRAKNCIKDALEVIFLLLLLLLLLKIITANRLKNCK